MMGTHKNKTKHSVTHTHNMEMKFLSKNTKVVKYQKAHAHLSSHTLHRAHDIPLRSRERVLYFVFHIRFYYTNFTIMGVYKNELYINFI